MEQMVRGCRLEGEARGQVKYERLVAICRDHGVLTPEDPYVTWPGDGAGRILAQDTPRALMSQATDPEVAALMAMPKRQAERIASLMERSGGEAPQG